MEHKHFVGIDVSKSKLDLSIIKDGEELLHKVVPNRPEDITRFIDELDIEVEDMVFCMEFTGVYINHLVGVLQQKKAAIWLESALHIKRSLGLQRGKNDRVDAERIARFAYKNRDEVKCWAPPRKVLEQLKQLQGQRQRLITAKKELEAILTEKDFLDADVARTLEEMNQPAIEGLNNSIANVEARIKQLIDDDGRLSDLYDIVTSIDGVGTVTALEMIITTNEFINITEPRKYASYSGIAPYEHTSGSSIRGKTRVSPLANKRSKTCLHMAALAVISMQGEHRTYYQRKVEEGKNKMSVINAVRNRIVHRVFACVRDGRKYEKNYCKTLV